MSNTIFHDISKLDSVLIQSFCGGIFTIDNLPLHLKTLTAKKPSQSRVRGFQNPGIYINRMEETMTAYAATLLGGDMAITDTI